MRERAVLAIGRSGRLGSIDGRARSTDDLVYCVRDGNDRQKVLITFDVCVGILVGLKEGTGWAIWPGWLDLFSLALKKTFLLFLFYKPLSNEIFINIIHPNKYVFKGINYLKYLNTGYLCP
jgi:hypothetical protein